MSEPLIVVVSPRQHVENPDEITDEFWLFVNESYNAGVVEGFWLAWKRLSSSQRKALWAEMDNA